uniref:Uncharacterized protein n=1 Tax=Prasinoderma coloniale TaxID=156133 RepID=A0A7R9TFT7_9VIRI|mmetsp:Transcript_14189/g.59327  ORF Transcript_14189/g.59327 Transcript_14189/m.59327 type:complete len:794 (+) Transcript_14189:113-2494(+)
MDGEDADAGVNVPADGCSDAPAGGASAPGGAAAEKALLPDPDGYDKFEPWECDAFPELADALACAWRVLCAAPARARWHARAARRRPRADEADSAAVLAVKAALAADPEKSADARGSGGRSALHVTAELGLRRTAEGLLAAGCKLLACDHTGDTPMHIAAERDDALLELMLDARAEELRAVGAASGINRGGKDGYSALHRACSGSAVRALVAAGADVHMRNGLTNGEMPLHSAVSRGRFCAAEAMLSDSGANPNGCDEYGTPPLTHLYDTWLNDRECLGDLCGEEHIESMTGLLLRHGADPLEGDEVMDRPLICAMRAGIPRCVALMLRPTRARPMGVPADTLGGSGSDTLLSVDVRTGDGRLARMLLASKADPWDMRSASSSSTMLRDDSSPISELCARPASGFRLDLLRHMLQPRFRFKLNSYPGLRLRKWRRALCDATLAGNAEYAHLLLDMEFDGRTGLVGHCREPCTLPVAGPFVVLDEAQDEAMRRAAYAAVEEEVALANELFARASVATGGNAGRTAQQTPASAAFLEATMAHRDALQVAAGNRVASDALIAQADREGLVCVAARAAIAPLFEAALDRDGLVRSDLRADGASGSTGVGSHPCDVDTRMSTAQHKARGALRVLQLLLMRPSQAFMWDEDYIQLASARRMLDAFARAVQRRVSSASAPAEQDRIAQAFKRTSEGIATVRALIEGFTSQGCVPWKRETHRMRPWRFRSCALVLLRCAHRMSSRNGDVVRVSLVPAKGAVCCTLTLFDGHRERRDRLAGLGDMEPELVYRVLAALCQTMS